MISLHSGLTTWCILYVILFILWYSKLSLTRVGLETQPSPNATSSSVQMNGSKSNIGTISGSVAGAVAIVAVLLYIFFDRRRRDSIHVCRHDLGTSANPCLEYKYWLMTTSCHSRYSSNWSPNFNLVLPYHAVGSRTVAKQFRNQQLHPGASQ